VATSKTLVLFLMAAANVASLPQLASAQDCKLVRIVAFSALLQTASLDDSKEVIRRIAYLRGEAQQRALKSLLESDQDEPEIISHIFFYENRLRPALRSLMRDSSMRWIAVWLLAIIAAPEDVNLILHTPPPLNPGPSFPDRWAYGVASSLLNPRTSEEWQFLENCATDQFRDRWVDQGAIRSLMLIASSRSRTILERALLENPDRAAMINRALSYIDLAPVALKGASLEILAERISDVIKIGESLGNDPPRYNEGQDKALVDFNFRSGRDRLVYTATFHRNKNGWVLRGVQETMQILLTPPPPAHR
jgi:hypothetical protein